MEKIFTVRGVRSAELINLEGERIASSDKKGGDIGYVYALTFYEANKTGDLISNGNPQFISIAAGSVRHIVIPYKEDLILIIHLEIKTKLDLVLDMIKKAIS